MDLITVEPSIPIDILHDLLVRFLIFVPEAAKQNLIRICFQIEQAHWFYLDFYVGTDHRLKACSMYEFSDHVFQHLPELRDQHHKLNQILAEWKEYKLTIPTYGAIMLSECMKHALLVQSYSGKSWSFPKGKVNEEEDPAHCAVREVLEETGFDISSRINPDDYLEATTKDRFTRLYVIRNVPMETEFKPRTRCEIKSCTWFAVGDLPDSKKDTASKEKLGVSPNAFFPALPFVKRLKLICGGAPKRRSHRISASGNYSVGKEQAKAAKPEPEDVKLANRDWRRSARNGSLSWRKRTG